MPPSLQLHQVRIISRQIRRTINKGLRYSHHNIRLHITTILPLLGSNIRLTTQTRTTVTTPTTGHARPKGKRKVTKASTGTGIIIGPMDMKKIEKIRVIFERKGKKKASELTEKQICKQTLKEMKKESRILRKIEATTLHRLITILICTLQ